MTTLMVVQCGVLYELAAACVQCVLLGSSVLQTVRDYGLQCIGKLIAVRMLQSMRMFLVQVVDL